MPRIAPLTAPERAAMVAAARRLVGVPFKHRGRDTRGIDCIGVARAALQGAGREADDYTLYGRQPEPDGSRLRGVLRDHFGDPIPKDDLQPGDIVLMAWSGLPNHVAVVGDYYLGGLSLIHALAMEGRVVEQRLAGPWPARILEAYRPWEAA